jgi:hypothetical protein
MTDSTAIHETDTAHGTPDAGDDRQRQAAAIQAGIWLRRHPAISVPAGAALAFGSFVFFGLGPSDGTPMVAALFAAAIAALISWVIVLRVSGPRPRAGLSRAATGPAAESVRIRAAARPLGPAPPPDMAGALRIVQGILRDLQPGPERVTAVDPDVIQVRWDAGDPFGGAANLPGARHDKMLVILAMVRRVARHQLGVLHQLPQLYLVAEDGAVVELFGAGGLGRTGVITSLESAAGFA